MGARDLRGSLGRTGFPAGSDALPPATSQSHACAPAPDIRCMGCGTCQTERHPTFRSTTIAAHHVSLRIHEEHARTAATSCTSSAAFRPPAAPNAPPRRHLHHVNVASSVSSTARTTPRPIATMLPAAPPSSACAAGAPAARPRSVGSAPKLLLSAGAALSGAAPAVLASRFEVHVHEASAALFKCGDEPCLGHFNTRTACMRNLDRTCRSGRHATRLLSQHRPCFG